MIVLQRKSDGEMSDAKSFTYYPQPVDEEDIRRKRMKPLPNSDYKQQGNFDMNHSMNFRSDSRNGSNGDASSDGTQKPGSIPKFDNMSRQRYGQIPPRIAPGPRPTLHAPRTIQSRNMIHQTRQPDRMFSNQKLQFSFGTTANNTVNNAPTYLSANQIPNSSPANYSNHPNQASPGSYSNHPNQASPGSYSNHLNQASPGSINELSPTDSKSPVMHFINNQVQGHIVNGMSGAGSPYSTASVSPHMASPIQVDSPQMVAQGNGYLATENFQVSQIKSEVEELELKSSIQASGNAATSHPVQPSSDLASVDSLDMDLFFQPVEQFLNGQFDQQVPLYFPGQQKNTLGQLDAYSQYYGPQSCQYQARSATGGMYDNHALSDMVTEPALDFFDGYDEVDASRLDVMQYPMATADIELSGKNILDGDLAHIMPRTTTTTEVRITKEAVVATETQSSTEPVVTMETGVQAGVGAPRPVDCEVQTDANPMLKTALRTSQAMQSYAASGDIRCLLMVQRYLMSVGDENGDLPLHTSLINGKYEVFQNLLDVMVTLPDSYTRINAYNYNHQTPLHLAVLTNQPLAIDLLIRARADPTLVDRNGYSPAHLAVLYGYEDCMAYLLKYVRPDLTHDAPFPELNMRCYEGFTPLHLAAQFESLAMIKLLVRGRADVNIPDGKSGRTALHHAVEADELSFAAFLILQAGAHVNVKRFDGNTPLHIACGRGNVGMVALLMAGGADPDTENDDVHESSGTSSEDESMSESSEEEDDQGSVEGSTRRNDPSSTQAESAPTTTTDGESITPQSGRRASEPRSPSRRVRCRGMTPADFANCDDKIIRILNGEPYTSLECRENQNDDPECDQMVSQLKSIQLHSKQESGFGSLGIQSFGGDMYKVDYPTRVGLSKLLDSNKPGCDWLTLADRLNLRKVTEGQTGEQSPTRLLLTYYEECGGTISRLSNTLCDMNRNDAVNLLNNSAQVSSSTVSGSDKDRSHDEPPDSGFTTDSFLPSHGDPVIT